ncbi:penicillin-binding protein 1C [Ruegeria sp. 2205SS24-7]|uniref:penicillin-binding protein 1C n=1 Tax=Ruegeria discodermiae TaxID=3064389 RepID=UPI00274231A8|nr:penicillin-binding protein 1C [Ruegeria sp. 2205SS24-7]MDP5220662.1 penicillin-binding protein 1C [Ruegeria sp. 2205SS24-7]
MSKPARLFLGLAIGLFLAAIARDGFDAWVDRTVLPPVLAETSIEIRDRNGKLLRVYPVDDGIWRLRPGDVDPGFLAMLMRYEDKRFRTHPGVDLLALTRAVWQALLNGKTVSGGSTLTMQVARLIEDGPTGRWSGKLRQLRVALALERRLSKGEILSLYLTHAPYGANLEGIRAASLAWFGKEPRRLTPAEAALLVALPQSPEARRPDRHPVIARAARDRVLRRVAGQGVLETPEMQAALTDRLPAVMRPFPRLAPHLADRVRAVEPGLAAHDLTLDSDLQARLEPLIARAARRAGPQLSAAMIVANHQNGEILASIGSAGYKDERQGFVDMTTALRSPGSTLKPLIYGLAFDQGLAHPETLIHDGPVMFGRYAPRNFDGMYRGDVRVREALQMSLNIPVVRLAHELGPGRIMEALRRTGAAPRLPGSSPGLAVALGGMGLSLNDLAQLYASIAAGGAGPVLHYRLSESGDSLPRVISAVSAWQIGDILAGLVPPPGAPTGVLAYKTGTSYGHRDAWAIGYDGRHVIGVWIGRADGTPVPGAFGGDMAAPLLFEAFGFLKPAFDARPAPPPSALIVGTAELPPPLQRFRPRGAAFEIPTDAPLLLFPPDGARLTTDGARLTVKLRGGVAPYAVLSNERPLVTGMRDREFEIPNPGKGYAAIVVVDAKGRSDRISIRID